MGELVNSGIAAVGSIPWGSHFCQFYETADDLVDTLVPYFKAGIEGGEKCMWVTSAPLGAADALDALRNAVPDADERRRKGQIEIIDHEEWYLRSGTLGAGGLLDGWLSRKDRAISQGYKGLRLTGNTFFLNSENWDSFAEYEERVNDCFCDHQVVALCSYCLAKSSAGQVMDVVKNHQFALARRNGDWTLIEHGALKRAKEDLRHANEELERRVESRTADLKVALETLQQTTASLEQAVADKDVLLREVHHRVKNNLQIINSLLILKAMRSTDETLREAFNDTLRRITAMSLVHEALYEYEGSDIDFGRYLRSLSDAILTSFDARERVSVTVVAQGAPIQLDLAVPLGLIAVEALSNALKHAFPDNRDGAVTVSFKPPRNGEPGLLEVRDDGVGATEGGSRKGTGLNLVRAIAKQVDGRIEVTAGGGTVLSLHFTR